MAITRLAPSPTGALHLGNARTFLVNWLLARKNNWRIVMRIEDIDGPRVKKGSDKLLLEDLAWLGIDWDDRPVYQSQRLPIYASAIQKLLNEGIAYPCVCSRTEAAAAASAPHGEDGPIYPGTCRGRFKDAAEAFAQTGIRPSIRFKVSDEPVEFDDHFAGRQRYDPQRQLGDFVIAKADGTPAYQLAVVVDDAEMNITNVVRGDDLLPSAVRQILLYRALGLETKIPRYYHLPLVIGPDGKRLAKRHGDSRLSTYRQQGITPSRILALLASWIGIKLPQPPQRAADLLKHFDLSNFPRSPIVFDGSIP
jgi:glutamyl-tRNA synthetase